MTVVPLPLRRAVLAVVLMGEDALGELRTRDDGVLHEGPAAPPLVITWDELLTAVGDVDALTVPALQRRVGRWLRLRVALHDVLHAVGGDPADARGRVMARIRLRALPHDHAVHPGASWSRRAVMGGALDVGLALRGVDDDGRPDPEAVGVVPAALLVAAGLDVADATARAERHLADMATLASERLRRDPTSVLRPLGDADVLTLLAARSLREALVDGQGMRSAAVPVRTRGWLDLGRIDPAFALSAAELTEPDDRGFSRPVLVTRDEVTLIKVAGDPVRQSLADPSPEELGVPPRRRPA